MFNGLQLKDDLVFHQQVDSISAIELDPFASYGERELAYHAKSPYRQFVGQTSLVGGLKQTRAKFSMDFYCRTDNRLCQRFQKYPSVRSVCSVVFSSTGMAKSPSAESRSVMRRR